MKISVIKVLLVFLVVGIWEGLNKFHYLNPLILPAPSTIWQSFLNLLASRELMSDLAYSLKRVLFGFTISLFLGVSLGLCLGINRKLKDIFSPFINFLRPIPPIAWIPLAILWFGVSEKLSVFITMIASFFPIFLNTLSGVENVSREYLDVARCFGANKTTILFNVIFPSALPFILSGIRVGLGFAWMAVVAAEMVSSFTGLGYMITMNQQLLRLDNVIIGMITIGLMGLLMDNFMLFLKNKLVKWEP